MLSFLPSFLLAPFTVVLFVVNTIFWCAPLYVVALAKILVPSKTWRRGCTRVLSRIAELWSACNTWGIRLTQRIRLDTEGVEGLARNNSYMVTCNHQSWVDIVTLQMVLNRRIPFPRFFLKRQLIWVPVLGGAWWALDYPFMKRRSKSYLEKHPERRGEDLETTRRSLEKHGDRPITIMNFLEGTRFRPEKHSDQVSPYRHLLKPKAGGVAFALQTMGARLREMLDVTIVYPAGRAKFRHLFTGRIPEVVVRVRKLVIPDDLRMGRYLEDPVMRERFQAWIRRLWEEKDALIESILEEYRSGLKEPLTTS